MSDLVLPFAVGIVAAWWSATRCAGNIGRAPLRNPRRCRRCRGGSVVCGERLVWNLAPPLPLPVRAAAFTTPAP
jgi:hypothetical protein